MKYCITSYDISSSCMVALVIEMLSTLDSIKQIDVSSEGLSVLVFVQHTSKILELNRHRFLNINNKDFKSSSPSESPQNAKTQKIEKRRQDIVEWTNLKERILNNWSKIHNTITESEAAVYFWGLPQVAWRQRRETTLVASYNHRAQTSHTPSAPQCDLTTVCWFGQRCNNRCKRAEASWRSSWTEWVEGMRRERPIDMIFGFWNMIAQAIALETESPFGFVIKEVEKKKSETAK